MVFSGRRRHGGTGRARDLRRRGRRLPGPGPRRVSQTDSVASASVGGGSGASGAPGTDRPPPQRRPTLPALQPYTRRLLRHVRPIIVANRAPLVLEPADPLLGRPERLVKGAGGLVTALSSLATETGALWVAAARDEQDRTSPHAATPPSSGPPTGPSTGSPSSSPPPEAYDLYYNVIGNPLLWFIQHYLWDLAREPLVDDSTRHAWREGYVAVNRMFADRVAREAAAGDRPPLVLIQDYQMYLVRADGARAGPDVRLQHFVHIPGRRPSTGRSCPSRSGMRSSTGCWATTSSGSRPAVTCATSCSPVRRISAWASTSGSAPCTTRGRAVWVRHYPISVDIPGFAEQAQDPRVLDEERRIASWRPERLILRVDRTDLSKNIVRGFLAYERMLETNTDLHRRVQFWAFLQPSRQDIGDYRSYLGSVLSVAARINRRFSSGGWTPIRVEVEDNMYKAIAAYKCFDVLLVNPIYDGMNLVAKEGPLCNSATGCWSSARTPAPMRRSVTSPSPSTPSTWTRQPRRSCSA